jgi:hypothetical protein
MTVFGLLRRDLSMCRSDGEGSPGRTNTKWLTRREAVHGCVALALLAQTIPAKSADGTSQQNLKALENLIGRWRGVGEGQPGTSQVDRSYEPVLSGQFLMVRNTSVDAKQQRNPNGEVHEDVGFYGFDNARERIVFRQFHVERFVNQYVAATAGPEGETIVFESEAIENIPAGWRARETYRFSGVDSFEEVFELADPDKDFALYSRSQLRRV